MKTVCLLFSCLALLAAACGGANEKKSSESKNEPPATLDLKRGSFGGVALGSTVQKMHRVFGPASPLREGEPATALSIGDGQDYSPPVLTLAQEDAGPVKEAVYRYQHVVFIVSASKIGAIIVNDSRARIQGSNVGSGDKLARAKAAYKLKCGNAYENTEYEPFPACVGRVAPHIYVWFGGDPIKNVTIARVSPEGL